MEKQTKILKPDIGAIFRHYGPDYREKHRLSPEQRKAMYAIEACRTAALGGHVEKCDNCGYERPFYNSCRNRHCPQCQSLAREHWIEARKQDLLSTVYYHVVFTIPSQLNPLALVNKEVLYNILFRAASETLLQLARDPKHLGAEIGITAILHTWGQNLMDHPHLHCIVTGGGLSKDGQHWVEPKKTNEERNFFIHVNIISDLFKYKFLAYLKEAYKAERLKFIGKNEALGVEDNFRSFVNDLYKKRWVTFCKESFGGPEAVISYLGQYTHRVAISNNRIINVEHDAISFHFKDYADQNQQKIMTLNVFEFMRRFLLHILPHGFYKIRYYGILSNRNHSSKLKRCQDILNVSDRCKVISSLTWEELLFELTGMDLRVCPVCKKGHMRYKERINTQAPVVPP